MATYCFRFNFFFFNDTATTEIYTLSLHDALPICIAQGSRADGGHIAGDVEQILDRYRDADRKSTRLNSSHVKISNADFCLKKKKTGMDYISRYDDKPDSQPPKSWSSNS